MKKQVAQALQRKAEEIAMHFSSPTRALNHTGETFTVERVKILSEHMAVSVFRKSSDKLALALLYYIPAKERWEYFFPTDSHLLAFGQVAHLKEQIEDYNYKHNFKG